jgi:acyl-CoA synthetase (AMP-forming)/AMP-acid ligase II
MMPAARLAGAAALSSLLLRAAVDAQLAHQQASVGLALTAFCDHIAAKDGDVGWLQVLEAAVIAIPDERWGERPLLVVVPQPHAGEARPDVFNKKIVTWLTSNICIYLAWART